VRVSLIFAIIVSFMLFTVFPLVYNLRFLQINGDLVTGTSLADRAKISLHVLFCG